MREYSKKSESQSRTLDSSPKASRQALIDVILQRYKERNIQRYEEDEELIQGKLDTAQHEEIDEDGLLLGKFDYNPITEHKTIQREERPNNTGLPDNLKAGIENLSGYSMDNVKVHYNSSKPTQLQALAYTQGTDIHVAPGQEQYLSHEAWHVVQQMQGRVQPTTQLQGINVNANEELEKEADVMGGSINLQFKEDTSLINNKQNKGNSVCQFVPRNVWSLQDGGDMHNVYNDILQENGGALTPQQFADGLLASANPIFWYGNTPETDEQVEIMASANYLHEHKQNWQNELQQRQNIFYVQQQPPWEKYQRAVAAQTMGEPIQPPWFLNPNFGYNINDFSNIFFRNSASHELDNPQQNDPQQNDPQQILGRTYDRDTNFSVGSSFAQQQTRMLDNTSNYATCANSVGCILRLFDGNNMNAPHELRLNINNVVQSLFYDFQIEGMVIETPNYNNGGYNAGQVLTIRKNQWGITIEINHITTPNISPWIAQLVTPNYYNAVILAEDGLGIRYQIDNPDQRRNRGTAVALNDATMTTIRNRII